MTTNKISIIMPAYNAEKNISESIESVINQTYSNWELIIINDGSNDNTVDIINRYLRRDDRINLLNNKRNSGVSETRNNGLTKVQGEFIAFLDSDDIWLPCKLQMQMDLMKSDDVFFVFTGCNYINEEGAPYPGKFKVPLEVDYNKLKKQNVISTSSVLLHKDLIKGIHFSNDKIHEDYVMWLKILKNGVKAHGIQNDLLTYRLYKNSKSGNKIKSIKMTYGVFRELRISRLRSIIYTISHLKGSVVKYNEILR